MKYSVTQRFEVIPAEEPLHSHIDVTSSLQPGRMTRYEMVPDVLVPELLHELTESAKAALNRAFEGIKGAGNNGWNEF